MEDSKEKNKEKEKQRRKKHRIALSLNDKDYEQFLKILLENKKTAQSFLYNRVFKNKVEDTENYKLLAFQIKKMGVLLNQYLRLIQQGQTVQDEEIIKILLEVNKNLYDFLEEEKVIRSGRDI
jgi:hypothetical protein